MNRRRTAMKFAVLAAFASSSHTALRAQTCEVAAVLSPALDPERAAQAPFARLPTPIPFRGEAGGYEATAPAYVFPEDPLRSPEALVTLQRLAGDGTHLEGEYVRVVSGRLDDGLPTAGIDGQADYRFPFFESWVNCNYDPNDCARFDAANVYWHVDRVATEFWRDRMGIEPGFQPTYMVHLAGDLSAADPSTMRVLVRLGEDYLRNAALEDDILYHEYAHLVFWQEGFRIDTTSTVEARAIGEGFADYMVATFTEDPAFGEYARTCPPRGECEGPPDDPDMRRLDTDPAIWNWRYGDPDVGLKYSVCTRFHEGDGKCKTTWLATGTYAWAMIWSGLLWDVRRSVGPEVADRLMLRSIRSQDAAEASFATSAAVLVDTDRQLFGGAHEDTLRVLLARRGIRPASIAVDTPGGAPPDRVTIYPNPTRGRVTLYVSPARTGAVGIILIDSTGRRIRHFRRWVASPSRLELDLTDLPGGVYLVAVEFPSGRRLVRLVARS